MPFATVKLKPGVNSLLTPLQNEAGYSTSQLGRFKAGLFQTVGGWVKYVTSSALSGVPRVLHAWEDLNQNGWLAGATTTTLSVSNNAGTFSDITPQVLTTNPAVNFSTSLGSPTVTIVDASLTAPLTTADTVTFNTPVAVGGLILSGVYQVQSVLSTTSYTITAATNATANVSNGGAVPSFTTTSGSPSVTVALAAHGLTAGQSVVFPVSTTVGGLTISGSYSVSSVTDSSHVVIAVGTPASSGATASMNAGNAQFVYGITLGTSVNSGTGYGYGAYGAGLYGGTGAVATITGTDLASPDWTADNWGQDLIACPAGGSIYYWQPNGAYTNATPIIGAPQYNQGIFVSARYQILVAYGSTPLQNGIGVAQDPLFVRWCDQSNFFSWFPTVTNQAGGQRLYSGSRIIAGYGGPLTDLLWTDIDLWSMSYMGTPFIYGFNKVADNCGIVGAHAFATLASKIFWMSTSNFFSTDGSSVQALPCSVWDTVFQDLDRTNAWKCVAWSNTPANEVWFFYPSLSGGTGECDKYAKINTIEQVWDTGTLQRSAAIDQSVLGNPIAASATGVTYQHETSIYADGAPIPSSFQTGLFALSEGEEFIFVDRIYPDMRWGLAGGAQTSSVQITLYAQDDSSGDNPIDPPRAYGPFTVNASTPYIPVRIRGRYMSMAMTVISGFSRIGAIKYRFSPDGRR
jgi:hypothetical protein